MIKYFYLTLRLDWSRTGTTTSGLSGPENNCNEQILIISQTLRLELHHQMWLNVIPRTHNKLAGGNLFMDDNVYEI